MAIDFPYGKALPDKMLDEQDAINALYNMMLDQGYISIHKPLITGDEDAIDDVELVPGKINYIGADVQNVLEMKITPPQQAHFNLLSFLHSSLQESSVDAVQAGQTGGANTATEVRQASAAAARQFLLFLQFVFYGYKRKARLRVGNILQFLTTPTEVEKILGPNGEEIFTEAFNVFKVDTDLLNGKSGTRVIEVVDRDVLGEKLEGRTKEQKKLKDQGVEKMYITPDYIRNFEYDVEPIPDSTIKETPEVEKALEIEFQTAMMTMYPDKVNRDEMFEEMLRVFRKQNKNLKIQPNQQQPIQPGQEGQPQQGQPQGGRIGNQLIQQATGGKPGKPKLNQLSGKI